MVQITNMRKYTDKLSFEETLEIKKEHTGLSRDGLFVNINVRKLKEVNDVFQKAQELGISKEELVNPIFHKHLFKGRTQWIDLSGLGLTESFFFRYESINKIKESLHSPNPVENIVQKVTTKGKRLAKAK